MTLLRRGLFCLVLLLPTPWCVLWADGYTPDIREFEAEQSLQFAGNPAFALQGAVEFWLATAWTDDPGYDPVVLFAGRQDQVVYALAVLADRSGLSLQSGSQIAEVAVDLADDQLHHVVLTRLDDGVALMVDGRIRGSFDLSLSDAEIQVLHIASGPAGDFSFPGALGGLRFWDVPIDAETVQAYVLEDVMHPEWPHPDLESLLAYSDFRNGAVELTQAPHAEDHEQVEYQEVGSE